MAHIDALEDWLESTSRIVQYADMHIEYWNKQLGMAETPEAVQNCLDRIDIYEKVKKDVCAGKL